MTVGCDLLRHQGPVIEVEQHLGLVLAILAAQLERLAKHEIPGTEAVVKAMKAGKEIKGGLDYHQAQELLVAIDGRRKRGLASVRQAKLLMRHGLNPDASFEAARGAMAVLAAHGWRKTKKVEEELLKIPGLAKAG